MGKIYKQLSIEERTMIQAQLERGIKPAEIATGLNRSASTPSRELRRNGCTHPKTRRGPGCPPVVGGYRAEAAHKRAQGFMATPRVEPLPRARGEDRRGRIPNMASIHDRPPEVEEQLIPGHEEAISPRGRITARPPVGSHHLFRGAG